MDKIRNDCKLQLRKFGPTNFYPLSTEISDLKSVVLNEIKYLENGAG